MLKGKMALVTGGGRGIGKAIAMALAAEGAMVIVNYNGSRAAAEAVVDEITASGGSARAYQCDVSSYNDTKMMIDDIIKNDGALDILVNNAGIAKDNLMMRLSEADFNSVVDINLKGTFNCIKHVSRQMLKQKSGRIINLSSIVGRVGNAGQINYAASKAGIIGMTMSAAKELGSRGITVNAIAPGFIQTEMTEVLDESVKKQFIDSIPLRKLGETKDIADLAVYLASEKGRYITGQTISVDGGMYMG